MTFLSTIGKLAGATLGAVVGAAGVGTLAALCGSLPRVAGRLRLAGLRAPVEIVRDRWGVPHIYADHAADLFLAQGYVHAQDRLWQMEFQRRLGHGQLAEILGEVALPADRSMRIMGLGRVARREVELLDSEPHAALSAYIAGINVYIAQQRVLPIEFTLLRCRPRPWELADVQVLSKVLSLSLSENWTQEVLRARIVAAVGPERAAQIDPRSRDDHLLTMADAARIAATLGQDALRLAEQSAPLIGSASVGQGSNAWVVGGTCTLAGGPLLANDPHLGLQIPALWYENHLCGGGLHVSGASLPGAPGVLIGHNDHIAWGLTNVMADVQDLYIERFDSADPTRYQFQGAWEQAEIIREVISVRGRPEPWIEQVRVTRHGPVVSPLVPLAVRGQGSGVRGQGSTVNSQPAAGSRQQVLERLTTDNGQLTTGAALALRWTALEPARTTSAVLQLNQAHDWDSFRAALNEWHTPPQNFMYADVNGHFGYAMGGALPLRDGHDGRVPVPGWDGAHEWRGFIPRDELPHVFDPDEGFVVNANNRIVGDEYSYPLQAEWLPGYRAARIRELLAQSDRHDCESFARIQNDRRSLPGLELAALAGRLPVADPVAQAARDALVAWNGDLTASSVGGAIYARLREKVLHAAHADLAEPLETVVGLGALMALPANGYLSRALPQLLRSIARRDDARMPPGQSTDDVLVEAWTATLAELRAEYGDDVRVWRYGRFHQLTFRHPLGAVRGLARLFNRGPFPIGSDSDTVNMGNTARRFVGAPYYVAPSYRQILDTADWNRSVSVHTTGQSGQPASRHYDDFIPAWLRGDYHPMPWSRTLVEEVAAHRLVLQPKTKTA